MTFVYNNVACGRLRGGINSSQPYADLYPGDVHSFAQWTPGRYFYATITNALGNIEIVKVTDITGNRITIERGQDNTTAREWYDGAVINQRFNSGAMDTVIQQASRQVAFNPNGILMAAYPYEKVFQLGQGIWWKNISGTVWACVAGKYIPVESCLADRINSGVDTPTDGTYLMKYDSSSLTMVKLDLPATDGTVTKIVLRVRIKGGGRETYRLRGDDGGDDVNVLIPISVYSYFSDFTNVEDYCEDSGGYSKDVLDKLYVMISTVEPDPVSVSEVEVQLYDIGGNLLETLYPYSDMPTEEGRVNWIPVPPCGEEPDPDPEPGYGLVYRNTYNAGFTCSDVTVNDMKVFIAGNATIRVCELSFDTENLIELDSATSAIGPTTAHNATIGGTHYYLVAGTGMQSWKTDYFGNLTYIDNDIAGRGQYKYPCTIYGINNFVWVSLANAYFPVSFSNGVITRGTGTFGAGYSYDIMQTGGSSIYIGYRESFAAGYIAVLSDPNASGVLTLKDNKTLEASPNCYARAFYRAANFVYVACGNDGIRIYFAHGDETLTYIGKEEVYAYGGLAGHSGYLFAVDSSSGRVYCYEIDMGTGLLTFINYVIISGSLNKIATDGDYIYVTNGEDIEILQMGEL